MIDLVPSGTTTGTKRIATSMPITGIGIIIRWPVGPGVC
jgi:hypothetical protein